MAERKKRQKLKDNFFHFAVSTQLKQKAELLAQAWDISAGELTCRLLAAAVEKHAELIKRQEELNAQREQADLTD